jgi:hypothetical protein
LPPIDSEFEVAAGAAVAEVEAIGLGCIEKIEAESLDDAADVLGKVDDGNEVVAIVSTLR